MRYRNILFPLLLFTSSVITRKSHGIFPDCINTDGIAKAAIPDYLIEYPKYENPKSASPRDADTISQWTEIAVTFPAYQTLIEKLQSLAFIEKFNPAKAVSLSTRNVHIGYPIGFESRIFLKYPDVSRHPGRKAGAGNEELAFRISYELGLDVVPATLDLGSRKQFAPDILRLFLLPESEIAKLEKDQFQGIVLQEGIFSVSLQKHLDKRDPKPLVGKLNRDSIQKAALFNLIIGRQDAKRTANSLIAEGNRIIEIDNEQIGRPYSDSWVLSYFEKVEFSQNLIEDFLLLPENAIQIIFSECSHLEIPKEIRRRIKKNYQIVWKYFLEHQDEAISVKDLKKALHPPFPHIQSSRIPE